MNRTWMTWLVGFVVANNVQAQTELPRLDLVVPVPLLQDAKKAEASAIIPAVATEANAGGASVVPAVVKDSAGTGADVVPVSTQESKKVELPPVQGFDTIPPPTPIPPTSAVPPHAAIPPLVPANGGNGHGACVGDKCGNGQCTGSGCAPRGVYAEIGFGVLKPFWTHNPGLIEHIDTGDVLRAAQQDFRFDGQFVPSLRIGFGRTGGMGARISMTEHANSAITGRFVDDDDGLAISSAAPLGLIIATPTGDTLGAIQAWARLAMQIWDFEVTQNVEHGAWSLLFSGGLRYAHLEQNYRADTVDGDGNLTAALRSYHRFTGYGLTVASYAQRKLGSGGLALYTDLRGSVLFGDTHQIAGRLVIDEEVGDTVSRGKTSNERVMPVGELEFGLAFRRAMSRGEAFFKLGLVGQAWHEAGNSSRSTNGDISIDSRPLQGGTIDDPSLGLFGIVLRGGFAF